MRGRTAGKAQEEGVKFWLTKEDLEGWKSGRGKGKVVHGCQNPILEHAGRMIRIKGLSSM